MSFIQEAVSVSYICIGKQRCCNQYQTQKCPLELRFTKVVGSTKLRGTPLQTWYYIYRHLLMTTEMKSYTVVKDIRCILKLDLWPPQG